MTWRGAAGGLAGALAVVAVMRGKTWVTSSAAPRGGHSGAGDSGGESWKPMKR